MTNNFPETRAVLRKTIDRVDRLDQTFQDMISQREEEMERYEESRRNLRRVVLLATALIVSAILLLTWQAYESNQADHRLQDAIEADTEQRIATCVDGRRNFRKAFEKAADSLVDIAKTDPENGAPEDQERIESFRQPLRDRYTAELPRPEDCK